MKTNFPKSFIYIFNLILLVFVNPFYTKAAFPIKENQNQETFQHKLIGKLEEVNGSVRGNSFDTTQKVEPVKIKGDSGVFGLLGFGTALCSIFCLCILLFSATAPIFMPLYLIIFAVAGFVFGILGAGKKRKNKGFAIAAIILTAIPVTFFATNLLLWLLVI